MSTTNGGGANKENARKHVSGSRYRSRVGALCLLFEAEARDVDPVTLAEERQVYARRLNESGEEGVSQISDYAIAIVTGVAVELDHIDETIEASLTNWTLDRLTSIDRAILRIGSWELLYGAADVPSVTAIDEAVALAWDYSSEDGPSFVNAVLDRVSGFARSAQQATQLRQEATDPAEDSHGEDSSDELSDQEVNASLSPENSQTDSHDGSDVNSDNNTTDHIDGESVSTDTVTES